MRASLRLRAVVFLCIGLLLVPVGVAAIQHDWSDDAAADRRGTATDVTFVTTQGGSADVYQHAGSLVAVHTESREIIWRHDDYRRYMDVDPLDSDRVLVVAGERTGPDEFRRVAVELNWRTGEELRRFEVPPDTHDVDRIGPDRYVVADKYNPRAASGRRDGRVYVYDASTDEVIWEYVFADHYPPYPEAGGRATGYTHLNDVDAVDGGSAFLVSPRNFDRVMVVDRETKETRWTLGAEDDYDVLHEQHNPVLLDRDPLTVLVADSENDRVVEYRRTDGGAWELVWSYSRGLRWPRDADRLPNGNTLITDSANDRVLEVTPGREVVWEFEIPRGTYDAERLAHGNEPAGPPMSEFRDRFDDPLGSASSAPRSPSVDRLESSYNRLYQLVGVWLLPGFAGPSEFGFALAATLLLVGWLSVESAIRLPIERLDARLRRVRPSSHDDRVAVAVGGFVVVLGGLLGWVVVAESALTGSYAATALLLVVLGYRRLRSVLDVGATTAADRLDRWIRLGLLAAALFLWVLLLRSQVQAGGHTLLYGGLGLAVVLAATDLFARPSE
jgi:hypothetical protein